MDMDAECTCVAVTEPLHSCQEPMCQGIIRWRVLKTTESVNKSTVRIRHNEHEAGELYICTGDKRKGPRRNLLKSAHPVLHLSALRKMLSAAPIYIGPH